VFQPSRCLIVTTLKCGAQSNVNKFYYNCTDLTHPRSQKGTEICMCSDSARLSRLSRRSVAGKSSTVTTQNGSKMGRVDVLSCRSLRVFQFSERWQVAVWQLPEAACCR